MPRAEARGSLLKVRGLFLGNYNHETELASEQIFFDKI